MRIYVASLSDYNAGRLHGAWIDLAECGFDQGQVWEKINDMLKASPGGHAEEWAIHDHEGMPCDVREYQEIEELLVLCGMYEEHGEAFKAWLSYDYQSTAPSKVEEAFQDAYAGAYRSKEEWAEQFLDDTGALGKLDDQLKYYFDYAKYAHDVELNGDMHFVDGDDGKVYAFHNN